jgi:SAM-dependent methyltransferase
MLPWLQDPALAYEHIHRYAFAASLAEGRRVLDLGSGEGYGAALLASKALEVHGIDIDAEAVTHSAGVYALANLSFAVGSAENLSLCEDSSFDLIVCFEVIEHVSEPQRLLTEVRRVITSDGIFLCSTPNRDEYRLLTGDVNPFHVHEMDQTELHEALSSRFAHVALWGQRTFTGSVIHPIDSGAASAGEVTFVEYREGTWDLVREPAPIYLVAAASDGPVPPPPQSLLVDPDQVLAVLERDRADDAERELHEARVERQETEERLQGYMRSLARLETEVRELVTIADQRRDELVARNARVAELEDRQAKLDASIAWQLLQGLRAATRRPDGTRTAVGRAASCLLRAIARVSSRAR